MLTIKTIPINLTAVISKEPEANVPCGTCSKCCEVLSPFLTPEEIATGLYPISLLEPDPAHKKLASDIGPTVALYRNPETGGCSFHVNGACGIYEQRPFACKQFDCRKGHHPKISAQC